MVNDNKVKKTRLTDNPEYYKLKMREWLKERPIVYVVEINGVKYAFNKSHIVEKIRLHKAKERDDIVCV